MNDATAAVIGSVLVFVATIATALYSNGALSRIEKITEVIEKITLDSEQGNSARQKLHQARMGMIDRYMKSVEFRTGGDNVQYVVALVAALLMAVGATLQFFPVVAGDVEPGRWLFWIGFVLVLVDLVFLIGRRLREKKLKLDTTLKLSFPSNTTPTAPPLPTAMQVDLNLGRQRH